MFNEGEHQDAASIITSVTFYEHDSADRNIETSITCNTVPVYPWSDSSCLRVQRQREKWTRESQTQYLINNIMQFIETTKCKLNYLGIKTNKQTNKQTNANTAIQSASTLSYIHERSTTFLFIFVRVNHGYINALTSWVTSKRTNERTNISGGGPG